VCSHLATGDSVAIALLEGLHPLRGSRGACCQFGFWSNNCARSWARGTRFFGSRYYGAPLSPSAVIRVIRFRTKAEMGEKTNRATQPAGPVQAARWITTTSANWLCIGAAPSGDEELRFTCRRASQIPRRGSAPGNRKTRRRCHSAKYGRCLPGERRPGWRTIPHSARRRLRPDCSRPARAN
jgi:hypothetical protein